MRAAASAGILSDGCQWRTKSTGHENGVVVADVDKLVRMCRRSTAQMRPVLPLGQAMSVGMVGFLDGAAFRYLGTVKTMLGVSPGRSRTGKGPPTVQLVSGKDVSASGRIEGETSETFGAIAKAKARIEVTFGSDKSFLLIAQRTAITTMSEPAQLLAEMLKAYKVGLWRKNYCLVYQVGVASTYRAALSHQTGAKLLLSTGATVAAGPVPLGDLGASANYESSNGAVEQVVSDEPVTAFFNAYRVKDRLFKDATVEVASALASTVSRSESLRRLGAGKSPFEAA
jgi:hypothetical protein